MTKAKSKDLVLLDLEALKTIAKKEASYNPNFYKRYPGQLESALFSVNYRFENQNQNLALIAASYFVHIACGHCFLDGNKRFAVTFMIYFLNLNGYRLKLTRQQLRNIAIDIARPESKKISLDIKKEYLQEIIEQNLINLKIKKPPKIKSKTKTQTSRFRIPIYLPSFKFWQRNHNKTNGQKKQNKK